MAKTIIAGNALVIKSTLKLEDINLIKRFNPSTLTMRDEEGHAVFGADVSDRGYGSMNKHGVVFDQQPDSTGAAVVTFLIPPDVENKQEYAADEYGQHIAALNEFETKLRQTTEEIKHNRAAAIGAIEVAE